MDFGEEIFQLPQKFPKDESYNLTSQIRKAADSVA
jgi:four helix bundle protein